MAHSLAAQFVLCLSFLCTGCLTLYANESDVLIRAVTPVGRTSPNRSVLKTCDIYKDKVELKKQYGRKRGDFFMTTSEIKKISLEGIKPILAALKSEKKITKPNKICDVVATQIFIYPEGKSLNFYDPGGCGRPEEKIIGDRASVIWDITQQYCQGLLIIRP